MSWFQYLDRSKGPHSCWPFQGSRDSKGYGRIGRTLAHRFAWELAFGPIPSGLHVLHQCDNPPCCNPRHLWLGTNLDNIHDRVAKGRSRNGSHIVRGERHGRAKLTDADVGAIRASDESQYALARRYGVSQSTIWRVIHGRTLHAEIIDPLPTGYRKRPYVHGTTRFYRHGCRCVECRSAINEYVKRQLKIRTGAAL